MKTEAIVAAAGVGKRLRAKTRKPYLKILGKPILIHTLQALSGSADINKIIVVVNRVDEGLCRALVKKYRVKKIKAVVAGGGERRDSVRNGLRLLDKDTDLVLIHDGVRPFIDRQLIKREVGCAKKFGACVVGVPVKATVKRVLGSRFSVLGRVKETVDRKNLWEIQTPQVFKKDLILKAYEKSGKIRATDDSMLVEKLGVKVRAVLGSYNNIKITTPEDLLIAKVVCRNMSS
jgi:2-C-methyl-D-erythritol 4-phosphate cytidylyltransferase